MRSARWTARPAAGARTVGIVVAGALAVALAACGGSAPVEEAASPSPAPSTPAPPTTDAAPATTSSPSTSPATTEAPATTLTPLPVPAPVPEAGTVEPVVPAGHIAIPRIGVSMAMFEGVTDATLDLGPGHWPGTAQPGELGNVVVAGHRVSAHGVFRHVDQLVPGDEIIISNVFGVASRYVVTGTEIVQPEAVWIIEQRRAHTATLFACHPPGSVAQRIVVHAELEGSA